MIWLVNHITTIMKPLFQKLKQFFAKEWFLFVMLAAIAILVLLFECL
jgi:hypothetical protein